MRTQSLRTVECAAECGMHYLNPWTCKPAISILSPLFVILFSAKLVHSNMLHRM